MPPAFIFRKIAFWAIVPLLILCACSPTREQIVEIKFAEPPASESDLSRTLESLVTVKGIGGQYATGGIYLITHYGDREELFREENQRVIEHPLIEDTWRFCSAFSAHQGDSVTTGRNWDNPNVGSIIINLYRPANGYASVSFSRAIDLGFPLNMDLNEVAQSPWSERLLLAPFYAMGGINEHGLVVENPGVRPATIYPIDGKEFVFQTYLIRMILDQARNVGEAVELADKYLPFDLEQDSLNAHLFIVDAAGQSVVLEYGYNRWDTTYGDQSWQVLTNERVYKVPDQELRRLDWRYNNLATALDQAQGEVDWHQGLKMLRDVSQNGTTWSVIYTLPTSELHFSAYQEWDIIYHIKPF